MHAPRARVEAPQFELPQELVCELQRRAAPRGHDFSVEGWKPSLLERLIAKLTGRP